MVTATQGKLWNLNYKINHTHRYIQLLFYHCCWFSCLVERILELKWSGCLANSNFNVNVCDVQFKNVSLWENKEEPYMVGGSKWYQRIKDLSPWRWGNWFSKRSSISTTVKGSGTWSEPTIDQVYIFLKSSINYSLISSKSSISLISSKFCCSFIEVQPKIDSVDFKNSLTLVGSKLTYLVSVCLDGTFQLFLFIFFAFFPFRRPLSH